MSFRVLNGGFSQSSVLGQSLQGLAPVLSALLPITGSWSQHISCHFSSSSGSSSSSKKKGSSKQSKQQHKQAKQRQQQQQRNVSPAAWPQPARLVLPDRKATAPVLGRVPPSSRAAAASTASILRAAQQLHQQQQQQQVEQLVDIVDAQPSAAEQQQQQQFRSATSPAALIASPWEVVAALPQSSKYPLEMMADMDILTYLHYVRDTRMGMPSVFELGVAREQGHQGRAQLLRREALLWHILNLLPTQQQQQQHLEDGSSTAAAPAAAAAAAADGTASEVGSQEEQQQLFHVRMRVMQQHQSFISDYCLQDLTQQQLAEAAAAAGAACHAAHGATTNEVADCLIDYFVFKRAMQLMLLQRQHRQLMQQQQQQQEEEDERTHGSFPTANGQQPPLQQLSPADVADVDIWDAFFDADLTDYLEYLQAAAAGAPSVFTTLNPTYTDSSTTPQQQQQQQQQQQLKKAQQLVAGAAELLALLPGGMRERPGLLIGGSQLLHIASMSGARVEDVIEVLQDFYKLKRLGFRRALQVLMDAADDTSALDRL